MRKLPALLVACAAAVLLAPAAEAQPRKSPPKSVLRAGERLDAGERLTSPNRRYRLAMQRDGNLVLLKRGEPVWSAQTAGNPGARAVMQRDGNLVVVSAAGTPLFASGTVGHRNARLVVQRDGNVVVYSRGRRALWSTRTDSFSLQNGQFLRAGQMRRSPNQRYRLVMQPDGNLTLYDLEEGRPTWSAQTEGNPGAITTLGTDGHLVVYSADGDVLYRSGRPAGPGARLLVQDDGNVVVYAADERPQWASKLDIAWLMPGQVLRPGQWRTSWDRRFRLQMQSDGNLVLVTLPSGRPLWSTRTTGHAGAWAAMQLDGNFVVHAADGRVLWQTGTSSPGARLAVQTDGNVVLYTAADAPLWSRHSPRVE